MFDKKEADKKYYQKNREYLQGKRKEYWQNNKDKIKIQLSVSELKKIEDEFRKYEDKKINIDEFYPTLYKLKDHFESYYDVKSQSKNIFEDLASIVRQILHKKYLINKDTHSSEFKIVQMIIGLKEIIPLEVSFVKYLPFVLKPKSN